MPVQHRPLASRGDLLTQQQRLRRQARLFHYSLGQACGGTQKCHDRVGAADGETVASESDRNSWLCAIDDACAAGDPDAATRRQNQSRSPKEHAITERRT